MLSTAKKPSGSSLDTVVNKLIRASVGSSLSPKVADEDLDRYVQDLIRREANEKAEQYLGKAGIRAYLPEPESTLPKTNKRFLSSILRNTDDHNRAVIKAQEEAANEAKREREEAERRERRARADEAAGDRLRRLMGGSLRRRDSERESRSSRKDKDKDDKGKGKIRAKSPPPRDKEDKADEHEDEDEDIWHWRPSRDVDPNSEKEIQRREKSRRKRARSASPETKRAFLEQQSKRRRSSSPSTGPASRTRTSERTSSHRDSGKPSKKRARSQSSSPERDATHAKSRAHRSPSPDEEDGPPVKFISKMDKYFEKSYDPRLDIDTSIPIPKDGTVPDFGLDNWSIVLEMIKQQREEKALRKQVEKLERKMGKKVKRKKGEEDPSELKALKVLQAGEPSVMDVEYSKRGTVREWDIGKT